MDCILPGHSIRQFCSAITALSRVGDDLYIEFDPTSGLALRSLNDAKSAYACARFEPGFFERCTTSPTNEEARNGSRKRNRDDASQESSTRFACRVPFRALAIVIRPRKNVLSLRVFNETIDSALYLSFQFQVQEEEHDYIVTHQVKAASARGVAAVAPIDDASELQCLPHTLSQLLDPLPETNNAALALRKSSDAASAYSFYEDEQKNVKTQDKDAAVSASRLKSETAVGKDEFLVFDFRSDRAIASDVPQNVNDEVVLVFPLTQAKALLKMCKQISSTEQELPMTMYFHWGGRPLVFSTETGPFSVQLVLATLRHDLLKTSPVQ